MIKLHIADSVWTITNLEGKQALNKLLSFEKTIWVPGNFNRKKKTTYTKHLIHKGTRSNEFLFLTGLIPRVLNFLDRKELQYEYTSDVKLVEFDEPEIEGLVFRDYQADIISMALEEGRGVIKAATATGKSIMILGIISAFSQENILLLVHTTDLVKQLTDDLEKYGFDVSIFASGSKEIGRITVATIQSFKKVVLDYVDFYDIVIIDESHHIRYLDSKNYGFVLQRLTASVRFGFTATMPETIEGKMSLEALVGPVITDYSMQKANQDGILAKPLIYVLETEYQYAVSKLSDYPQVYKFGIALNTSRNQQIVDCAIDLRKDGRTTLILINRLVHGEELIKAFAHYGHHIDFVQGSTEKEERSRLKEALKTKKISWLIASVIFCEGIDLPAMDCLINASGGKSEVAVLQKIGRGLRKTETKKDVIILDFMDTSHRYLRNHYNKRMAIYKDNGWEVSQIVLDKV